MRKSEFNKYALNYIKAITARGGDGYEEWEEYDNDFCQDCFSGWLNEQQRYTGKLYRGFRIDKENYSGYQVGEIIEQSDIYYNSFPSFTTSDPRAYGYINDYEVYTDDIVKIVFEVECSGKYAVDISKHSYYPQENEHKFVSNAKFEVVGIGNLGHINVIKLKEV